MSFLKPDQMEKIEEVVGELEAKYNQLILTFNHHQHKTEHGGEHARHGYRRWPTRLNTAAAA